MFHARPDAGRRDIPGCPYQLGLPLADRIKALTGRWRREPDHPWAAFSWPAQKP